MASYDSYESESRSRKSRKSSKRRKKKKRRKKRKKKKKRGHGSDKGRKRRRSNSHTCSSDESQRPSEAKKACLAVGEAAVGERETSTVATGEEPRPEATITTLDGGKLKTVTPAQLANIAKARLFAQQVSTLTAQPNASMGLSNLPTNPLMPAMLQRTWPPMMPQAGLQAMQPMGMPGMQRPPAMMMGAQGGALLPTPAYGGGQGGMMMMPAMFYAQQAAARMRAQQELAVLLARRKIELTPADVNHANRVYIGSIPAVMTEAEIRSMFQPFGNVKRLDLMQDTDTGQHRGYAFVEFAGSGCAEKAIQAINGMKIGDHILKVTWAARPTEQKTASSPEPKGGEGTEPTAKLGAGDEDASPAAEVEQSGQTSAANGVGLHSNCVVFRYACEAGEPLVSQEISEQCSAFGQVQQVVEKQITRPGANVIDVNVYVRFRTFEEAKRALSSLNKRLFGAHSVDGEYVDEDYFYDEVV